MDGAAAGSTARIHGWCGGRQERNEVARGWGRVGWLSGGRQAGSNRGTCSCLLSAGVGVLLSVQDQDVHVLPGGQHVVQARKADLGLGLELRGVRGGACKSEEDGAGLWVVECKPWRSNQLQACSPPLWDGPKARLTSYAQPSPPTIHTLGLSSRSVLLCRVQGTGARCRMCSMRNACWALPSRAYGLDCACLLAAPVSMSQAPAPHPSPPTPISNPTPLHPAAPTCRNARAPSPLAVVGAASPPPRPPQSASASCRASRKGQLSNSTAEAACKRGHT